LPTDPYAPPAATVAVDAVPEAAPALWNPNAAANWSLLFSPAFGAWLHMKNWQALGDPHQARINRGWIIATLGLLVGSVVVAMLLPDSKGVDAAMRAVGLGLLVGWYVSCGKVQAKLVKERFGTTYPRRGWALPILAAIGGIVAFFVLVVVIGLAIGLAIGP
jgi:hypothetical protein